ncbi:DUF501 domain-containing protein [Hydrogenivirga sp.]
MLKVVENPIVVYENGIHRPEPTRFWILDREFRSAVSRLESEGYIRKLSEEITQDEGLFNLLTGLHEREVSRRKEILERDFPEVLHGEGKWDRVCREVLLNPDVGIGGIRKFRSKPFKVRCLHLWTAYHLGEEEFRNPIGEFVLSKL